MSVFSLQYAMEMKGISPVAKLVAIYVLDGRINAMEGEFSIARIADFACAGSADVGAGLIELMYHGFQVKYGANADQVNISIDLPEPERAKPREFVPPPCSIYVVEAGGYIKIGIAEKPEQRFSGLQTSNPHSLIIHMVFEGPGGAIRGAERTAHEILAENRLTGEWFKVSPQVAIAAVRRALQRNNIEIWEETGR